MNQSRNVFVTSLFFILYLQFVASSADLSRTIKSIEDYEISESKLAQSLVSSNNTNKSYIVLHREKRRIVRVRGYVIAITEIKGMKVSGAWLDNILNTIKGMGKRSINNGFGFESLNYNFEKALAFKEILTKYDPILGQAIIVNKNGLECDGSLCRKYDNTQIALGFCTRFFCHCVNGEPYPKFCNPPTVYDPIRDICTWPQWNEFCEESQMDYIVDQNEMKCKAKLCRRFGNTEIPLGNCTSNFCHCANGIPYQKFCNPPTIFDPVNRVCDWRSSNKLCNKL